MSTVGKPGEAWGGGGKGVPGRGATYTPEEMANIKAHNEFIKSNPDRFAKDPENHNWRMKNDFEYKSDQSTAKYVRQAMKEVKAQENPKGTQKGHAVTNSDNHTRPVK